MGVMVKAAINPEILKWARIEAGLSLMEAANSAKISSKQKKTPDERLSDWESGQDQPTVNQLKSIAKTYYRPFLTFFMQTPPVKAKPVEDFRTIGDHQIHHTSDKLSALIRQSLAKQSEIRTLLEEDGYRPAFINHFGNVSINNSIEEVVYEIRSILLPPEIRNIPNNDKESLFKSLRDKIEEIGVFVLLIGDLGHHTTQIDVDEFRGLALSDPIAPFILINSYDAKPAQLFTMLHELVHLWVDEPGISAQSPFKKTHNKIERFCNKITAELLLPRLLVKERWQECKNQSVYEIVNIIAKEFAVSRVTSARRLFELQLIKEDTWWGLYNSFKKELIAIKKKQKESEGGPDYYVVKSNRLGNKYINTVLNSLDKGNITYTRAAGILGVKTQGLTRLYNG